MNKQIPQTDWLQNWSVNYDLKNIKNIPTPVSNALQFTVKEIKHDTPTITCSICRDVIVDKSFLIYMGDISTCNHLCLICYLNSNYNPENQ